MVQCSPWLEQRLLSFPTFLYKVETTEPFGLSQEAPKFILQSTSCIVYQDVLQLTRIWSRESFSIINWFSGFLHVILESLITLVINIIATLKHQRCRKNVIVFGYFELLTINFPKNTIKVKWSCLLYLKGYQSLLKL